MKVGIKEDVGVKFLTGQTESSQTIVTSRFDFFSVNTSTKICESLVEDVSQFGFMFGMRRFNEEDAEFGWKSVTEN